MREKRVKMEPIPEEMVKKLKLISTNRIIKKHLKKLKKGLKKYEY